MVKSEIVTGKVRGRGSRRISIERERKRAREKAAINRIYYDSYKDTNISP